MIRTIVFPILVAFVVPACKQDTALPVEIGQEKNEIVKVLGEPNEKKNTRKSSEHIWGPEEEFWAEIPMGTKLEVGRYSNSSGWLNLYFVDGSDRLSFKAFAPAGVVD